MSGRVLRLRWIGRNVADLARMVGFYRDALDFALVGQSRSETPAWGELMGIPGARAQVVRLRLGAQELELTAFDPAGAAYPAQADASDLCFQHLAIVVADMSAAYARVRQHRLAAISIDGPQTLPPNTGGVSAFKFRDPEGHPLELIHFPAGVGAPCWQVAPGLFQGIDHSAIAVADTAASVAFYGRMGWRPAGRSHNQGPAQDRLDGLRDANVQVVGLKAARAGPPHLELLGYRVLRGHRSHVSAAGNDLAADRLVFDVDDLHSLLAAHPASAHSPVVGIDGRAMVLLRDPDGHRLLLQAGSPTAPG